MNDPRRGPPPKPHDGKPGCCCWCGEPVPKGRRRWCSDRCVQDYLAQTPGERRARVLERDGGVCAKCGRDCLALEKRLRAWLSGWTSRDSAERIRALKRQRLTSRLGVTQPGIIPATRTLWEADHIVPICEGGSNALDNLRTLCLCCHKRETRALAKRRAESRTSQLSLEIEVTT